jgi:hypothetical protein
MRSTAKDTPAELGVGAVLGLGDLRDDARVRELVGTHPSVAFRPAEGASTG